MENVLSMILLMAIYIIAAAFSGKKKKKKARAKGFQSAFDGGRIPGGQSSAQPGRGAPAGGRTAFVREEDCAKRPIHLHEVPQSVMHAAGEGEDPCHAGGVYSADENPLQEADDVRPETGGEAAQDLLRGVIMSEILTRPCERRAIQRNRRRI